jgi:hypothetical protein
MYSIFISDYFVKPKTVIDAYSASAQGFLLKSKISEIEKTIDAIMNYWMLRRAE